MRSICTVYSVHWLNGQTVNNSICKSHFQANEIRSKLRAKEYSKWIERFFVLFICKHRKKFGLRFHKKSKLEKKVIYFIRFFFICSFVLWWILIVHTMLNNSRKWNSHSCEKAFDSFFFHFQLEIHETKGKKTRFSPNILPCPLVLFFPVSVFQAQFVSFFFPLNRTLFCRLYSE